MIHERLPTDEWIPWKLGDPVPPLDVYNVTAEGWRPKETWVTTCVVLPADNVYQNRFDWHYTSTIVAYLPRPLPAPYPLREV